MPGNRNSGRWKLTPQQWAAVDWSLRDADLAPLLGVTRQRVQQVRAMLGKPRPAGYRKRAEFIELERWAAENAQRLSGRPWTEIYAEAPRGCSQDSIRAAVRRAGGAGTNPTHLPPFTLELVRQLSDRPDGARGCWLWRGKFTNDHPRYGSRPGTGGSRYVRRELWLMLHGSEPEPNYVVTNKCRNLKCVNPRHLMLLRRATWLRKVNGRRGVTGR